MNKAFFLGLALLSGCASYTSKTKAGLDAFEHRDFPKAVETYTPGAEAEGVDQLVYLFDRGTVRHTAGDYEASIKDFLIADKLSEIKDYTALGTEIATIITNDRITEYKGEEFEHVLVSAYLAMDFAFLGKSEDAIVECRRVNRKLELLRQDGKRNYDLNAFAQYLSGILYEKDHNWNSAYVDFRKTYEILPTYSRLRKDLVRGALRVESSSDIHKWKKTFGITDEEIRDTGKELRETGSIVLLYQNGFAPEKVVSKVWHELPEYQLRYNKYRSANIYLNDELAARSEIVYDVEKVALENLKSKYATYIAKRVAGVVAREVIGDQIDKHTNNSGLGFLAKVVMTAASQPDLRSWLTLPKNFQIARAQVKPGRYYVKVKLEDIYGRESHEKDYGEIEIQKPGDVQLLGYRSLND